MSESSSQGTPLKTPPPSPLRAGAALIAILGLVILMGMWLTRGGDDDDEAPPITPTPAGEVQSELAPEQVTAVLGKARDAIRGCQSPDGAIDARFRVRIARSGAVEEVAVVSGDEAPGVACLKEVLGGLRFPAGDAPVVVQIPIALEAGS